MDNILEKSFINVQLGIKFNSYIDHKCRVWFNAKEVAQILGYKKTENAINRHASENHKRTFLLTCPRETRGQVRKSYPVDSTGQVQNPKSCPPETGGQVIKCCPPETGRQQNVIKRHLSEK